MFGGGDRDVLGEKRRGKNLNPIDLDRWNEAPQYAPNDAAEYFFGRRSHADQVQLEIHEQIDVKDPVGFYQHLASNCYYGLAPLLEPELARHFIGPGRYILLHAYGNIINAFNTLESLTFNRLCHQRAYLEDIWRTSCETRSYFWPSASILLKIITLKRDFFEFVPAVHPKTKRDTLEIIPLFLTYLKPDGIYRVSLTQARAAILQVILADLLATDLKRAKMKYINAVENEPITLNPRLSYELPLKDQARYPQIPEFGSNGNPAGAVIAKLIHDFYKRANEDLPAEQVDTPEEFKELVSMVINFKHGNGPTHTPIFETMKQKISQDENVALNQLSVGEIQSVRDFLKTMRKREKEKNKKRRQRSKKVLESHVQTEGTTETVSLSKRPPGHQTPKSSSQGSSNEKSDQVA